MDSLEKYRVYFDQAYPSYSDSEYSSIRKMIDALPTEEVASEILGSCTANKLFKLVIPIIAIKNYKSQIPFPERLYAVVKLIVEIKNTQPNENVSDEHARIFDRIIDIKGFQLPTVSAVLHFCFPENYPIVDRNIEAACGLLSKEFPIELKEEIIPSLPASTTSSKNKLSKYRAFITFLAKVKKLHNEQHNTRYGFRELDKALMVYGVSDLKVSAEIWQIRNELATQSDLNGLSN